MNTGFSIYQWRGEPIENIEEWAKAKNEKMIDIIWEVKHINPYAKKAKDMITYERIKDTMPISFFNHLRVADSRKIISKMIREPYDN